MTKKTWLVSIVAVGAMLVGCASESEGQAPEVEIDLAAEDAIITSVNAQGTWTAEAHAPGAATSSGIYADVWARATFTGPAGATRRMGACLLELSTTPCTTTAGCNAPPAGGFTYCAAPNNTGQKYCAYRRGPASTWCTGTPALAGNPPIAPGYRETGWLSVYTSRKYISYACFEGCSATDPSVSSGRLSPPACGGAGMPPCP
jgi:hypothetical protein